MSHTPIPTFAAQRPSWRGRLIIVAVALALLGCVLFLVDLPVARWCKSASLPDFVVWFLNFSEHVANGKDVAALLLCLLVVDPSLRAVFTVHDRRTPIHQRLTFPRIAAAALGGGIIVQIIKSFVPRVRPRVAELSDIASSLATFGEPATGTSLSHYDLGSFPSGHAAVAAGFATALCWRYLHATPLFCLLAISAALQRVASSAHYPSDIAFGAAIGLLIAATVLPESR